MREIAETRVRYGYRRIHVLLRRKGGEVAMASDVFPALLKETLIADSGRGGGRLAQMVPTDRLAAMLARLTEDTLYPDEYARFVGGMAFAGEAEIPSFYDATLALRNLSALLPI